MALAGIRRGLLAHRDEAGTRDAVLTAIAHTSGLVTPIGSVAFDAGGNLRAPIVSLYRVRGGKIEFVGQSDEARR